MEKRPLSLTIIASLIIIICLLSIVGIVMAGTPTMTKAIAEANMSVATYRAWGGVGVIVSLACAYGILKGEPWSRVLYLVWGIIGLVVQFAVSKPSASTVAALIIFVVVCAFLWTNTANDWFQARGLMLKRERAR